MTQPRVISTMVALLIATATCGVAQARLIGIEFRDPDGPQWTGIVDTTLDHLTILTWFENPGGIEFWTPDRRSLPLVWPALDSTGNSFDVPDAFRGTITDQFAFVSPSRISEMAWNEGVSDAMLTQSSAAGWGGGFDEILRTDATEAFFGPIPFSASGLAAEFGTIKTVPEVPEPTALLLGGVYLLFLLANAWRIRRGKIRATT